jgi:ketosteroid isomerase-like protein
MGQGPVEDRLAIRELVEAYNDAVMRFDAEAWEDTWADDAVWSLPEVGEMTGKANFVPIWKEAMSQFGFVGFYASAGPILVQGETAKATWYQQEFLHKKDGARQVIAGRYDDDYVKRDGRWFFKKRVYSILNFEETPAG